MARLLILVSALIVGGCEMPQSESGVSLPAPTSDGAQILKKYCSDCHAPPSPQTHVATEWPNVIYRMQERRRMEAFELINEHEQAILIKYLQKYSKS